MKNKKILIIAIVILILVAAGIASFIYFNQDEKDNNLSPIITKTLTTSECLNKKAEISLGFEARLRELQERMTAKQAEMSLDPSKIAEFTTEIETINEEVLQVQEEMIEALKPYDC